MNDAIKTQLSAFVDGELSEAEAGLLIRRLSRDPDLRDLVEDYQSIGRVLRAETAVAGTDQLLGRIHSELNDSDPAAESTPATVSDKPDRKRPMIAAAAATVAMFAVFTATQFGGVDEATTAESYTVPDAADEIYFERHGQSGSSFSTRVVTYQLQSENLDETSAEDAADDGVESEEDTTEESPAAE